MDSETLGRNARAVVRRQPFARIGIILGLLAVTALIVYWVTPQLEPRTRPGLSGVSTSDT
jgi:hypothetical protein